MRGNRYRDVNGLDGAPRQIRTPAFWFNIAGFRRDGPENGRLEETNRQLYKTNGRCNPILS